MPSTPLTHHEIISLIEPFTRRGHRPDLAESNRLERRLVFKPVERRGETPDAPVYTEKLELDSRISNAFRLTRTLTCTTGSNEKLKASLEVEGEHVDELLTVLESVAPQAQFSFGPGFVIARNYRLVKDKKASAVGPEHLVLTQASALLDGLSVNFAAPKIKGWPEGEIVMSPTAGEFIELPADLLAVLGRDWDLLDQSGGVWKSSLSLRGKEPQKSRRGELKIDLMARHLAQTLCEKPARFHERLAGARWGVALRRITPLMIFIAAIAGTFFLGRLNLAPNSSLRLLMFNAPPLFLMLVFTMRRVPRIEIPPIPRRSKEPSWRKPMVTRSSTPTQQLQ